MKSLREFAQFVGKPQNPISIQALSFYLFNEAASSLRTMMQQFEALPTPFDFTLDVKPQSGSAPLLVNTRYANFAGIRIWGALPNTDGFRVLKGGQVIRVVPSETGFAHRFDEGGQYVIEGSEQGVGRDGYARVVKTVTVVVQAPPPPPGGGSGGGGGGTPPPPLPPLQQYRFCVSSTFNPPQTRDIMAQSYAEARHILEEQLGELGAGDSWTIGDGPCP